MQELTGDELGRLCPLFADAPHHRVFACSVIEGHHVGRAFVDRADAPSSALLYCACEFHLLAGRADNDEFNREMKRLIVSELMPRGGELLLMPASAGWRGAIKGLFAGQRQLDIARRSFRLDRALFEPHRRWRERVPAGYSVRRYDREVAATADGLSECWGSLDCFIANGFGFVAQKGDEIVSRCHTVLRGDGKVEISVGTTDAHRRQGLAILVASALIEHSLEAGLEPVWSCWDGNAPSIALAGKLGFVPEPDMPVTLILLPPGSPA